MISTYHCVYLLHTHNKDDILDRILGNMEYHAHVHGIYYVQDLPVEIYNFCILSGIHVIVVRKHDFELAKYFGDIHVI